MDINGYVLTAPLKCDKSGFSKWGFAEKNGKEVFIKEFLSPVYPPGGSLFTPEQREAKIALCKKFETEKSRLYQAINDCSNGNIMTILEFFRCRSHYYVVTEKVNARPLTPENLGAMSPEQKLLITKIIVYSLSMLHSRGVVHGDIKPDNVLFAKSPTGVYTAKLIDFDSSFFADNPPENNDDFQGDMLYLSPEGYLYMDGTIDYITTKADVFSLGIMLHLLWSGELPWIDKNEYDYIFEAVLSGGTVGILRSIPRNIAIIIKQMLSLNPEKRPALSSVFMALAKVRF